MQPERFPVEKAGLESWLNARGRECFPPYNESDGEISYPERYQRIKEQLIPYHGTTEKGALLESAKRWCKLAQERVRRASTTREAARALSTLRDHEPLVYLNNHGVGHVDRVILRASDFLSEAKCGLTAYEGYLLLSAIQFHDIGNVFGRDEHEQRCGEIMESIGSQVLRDRLERSTITRIAMVHGGCWNGDSDTISLLNDRTLFAQPVRKRLLAAVLRFADELADDYSRADRVALEQNLCPRGAEIYHRYSECLHSVQVDGNSVRLGFQFPTPLVVSPLMKGGRKRFLLDEIYYRTLKMERERRYCSRFMRPFVSADRIHVEIVIESAKHAIEQERITYTLEEKGYPNFPALDIKSFDQRLRRGSEVKSYLGRKWDL